MSSASAAEGTPESRRLLEDIQNMVQANILLRESSAPFRETKLCCVFVKFPVRFWSSVLNMKVVWMTLAVCRTMSILLSNGGFPG